MTKALESIGYQLLLQAAKQIHSETIQERNKLQEEIDTLEDIIGDLEAVDNPITIPIRFVE